MRGLVLVGAEENQAACGREYNIYLVGTEEARRAGERLMAFWRKAGIRSVAGGADVDDDQTRAMQDVGGVRAEEGEFRVWDRDGVQVVTRGKSAQGSVPEARAPAGVVSGVVVAGQRQREGARRFYEELPSSGVVAFGITRGNWRRRRLRIG